MTNAIHKTTRHVFASVLHIGCSIAQTYRERSGSRITRRNDHRKAVIVPRSTISANLVYLL